MTNTIVRTKRLHTLGQVRAVRGRLSHTGEILLRAIQSRAFARHPLHPPPSLAPAISESSGPEWGGGGRGKGRAEGVGDVWKCTSEEGNGGKDLRGRGAGGIRGCGGIVGEFP